MLFTILDASQAAAAVLLNSSEAAVQPRLVDAADPGSAENTNANASGIEPGEHLALAGSSVVPQRVVTDPSYQQGAGELVAYLLSLPWAELEPATIFASVETGE